MFDLARGMFIENNTELIQHFFRNDLTEYDEFLEIDDLKLYNERLLTNHLRPYVAEFNNYSPSTYVNAEKSYVYEKSKIPNWRYSHLTNFLLIPPNSREILKFKKLRWFN